MKKDEKGAITLEASLILTMFIMGFMCMMSLVQIVRAQTILQYAVDQAALDLSRNSYLLTKSGIASEIYGTSENAQKFEGDTAEVIGNVKKLYSDLGTATSSNAQTIIPNAENVIGSYNNAVDGINSYKEEYFSDSDEIWNTLVEWGVSKGEEIITTAAVSALAKAEVKKQLKTMGQTDPDAYLKELGVKDGLDGLDFKGSQWMQANGQGRPGIKIEMSYDMEFNWYYFLIKDLRYKVTAYTALW